MKEALLIITYLVTGFGCYVIYWRFTDADYGSKFDRFWGIAHVFLWPVTLFVGLMCALVWLLENFTVNLIRKRHD